MRLRTAERDEVPFDAVAEVNFVPGYNQISRTDRKRSIVVSSLAFREQAADRLLLLIHRAPRPAYQMFLARLDRRHTLRLNKTGPPQPDIISCQERTVVIDTTDTVC